MAIARALGRGPRYAGILLESIKFEHTIFALPFAYLGMLVAAQLPPSNAGLTWQHFVWITAAMVGGRTLAMASNRIIDAKIDGQNPRTAVRPLQRGAIGRRDLWALAIAGAALFFGAAWQLNPLCLALSPLAAIVLVGYSYTKRFTWMTHYVLGIADGIAPVGAWYAVTGVLSWEPLVVGLGVALWIAGFDILYACQDLEFDRKNGVQAIPARFGLANALRASSATHALAALALLAWGPVVGIGPLYYVGWVLMAGLLIYEHWLVKADDMSRLNVAFFDLNGYVSIAVFVFTAGGVLWR
jgi:4-hydroxybenzoate polyprenyltransferase